MIYLFIYKNYAYKPRVRAINISFGLISRARSGDTPVSLSEKDLLTRSVSLCYKINEHKLKEYQVLQT